MWADRMAKNKKIKLRIAHPVDQVGQYMNNVKYYSTQSWPLCDGSLHPQKTSHFKATHHTAPGQFGQNP